MGIHFQEGEIKKRLEEARWTQKQLAKATILSLATIERAVKGMDLSFDSHDRILNALQERLAQLSSHDGVGNSSDASKSAQTYERPLEHILGYYGVYALSTGDPSSTLLQANLVIQWDQSKLRARVNAVGYDYEGDVLLDSNSVTLLLNGDKHSEYLTVKFTYPLTPEFNCMNGVYAALTLDGLPVCGIMVAHKSAKEVEPVRIKYEDCDPSILKLLEYETTLSIIVAPRLKSNWLEEE